MENETPRKESGWDLLRFALLMLLFVIPIRLFIAQPFIVSGDSMLPTFHNKDYLIIDELSYRLTDPKRSDVIIFRYPKNPKVFYIKRIVGLPNETVHVEGGTITITNDEHPEGLVLEQPFVKNGSIDAPNNFELGDDEYFVMGDNRSHSSDSRFWGPVKKDLIIGRALVRLFPASDVGLMPGHYKQPE
ncbi:MAG TPA: signal peptidase I [Candidatus Paceibacterota bacterium]